MSNSARAKERRSGRSRATKHQRTIMASQHFGTIVSVKKTTKKVVKPIPTSLSAIEQKMAEMRDRL